LNSGDQRRGADAIEVSSAVADAESRRRCGPSNGTNSPKLVLARYGEPVLFRHHNGLPSTSDRTAALAFTPIPRTSTRPSRRGERRLRRPFFFPNQSTTINWPFVLAGHYSYNQTGPTTTKAWHAERCGRDDPIPGDWHETMGRNWFHDHIVQFTAPNIYKGNVAMLNIYSGVDPATRRSWTA